MNIYIYNQLSSLNKETPEEREKRKNFVNRSHGFFKILFYLSVLIRKKEWAS